MNILFRMPISDYRKVLDAVEGKIKDGWIASIEPNVFGDFVVQVNNDVKYIVKSKDFSVWRNFGDWRNPQWEEVK